jgi:hypothetical protein
MTINHLVAEAAISDKLFAVIAVANKLTNKLMYMCDIPRSRNSIQFVV